MLEEGEEVHVWYARLDLPCAVLHRLYGTLAPDEKSKAAQFRFHADRCRFIARRGILRSLLAKYTSIAPAEVELRSSEHGKLHIAVHQNPQIRFNLSYSQWLAIYAVTLDREVGIDIERIEQGVAWRDFSKILFTGREHDFISRLPVRRQPEAFFELWTRKESILKALGTGLQSDPAHINVADDYAQSKVIAMQHGGCLWKLLSLSADGFASTLTAAGAGWRVHRHRWTPG